MMATLRMTRKMRNEAVYPYQPMIIPYPSDGRLEHTWTANPASKILFADSEVILGVSRLAIAD
jgi:hypothetical protein